MSTHALVFTADNYDGLHGRYVHFDGYPDGVGAALLKIVTRDGLEKARDVIIYSHNGWCSITGERSQLEYDDEGASFIHTFAGENGEVVVGGDGATTFVVGYGGPTEFGDPITTETLPEAPFWEWAYLLDDSGLHFARMGHSAGDIQWIGKVPWSTRPEDLDDIVTVELSLVSA